MISSYIIGIGFTLVGAWWIYRAYAPRLKSRAAQNWPTVDCEILETNVEEDTARTAMGSANIAFIPTVRYAYTVNGQQYEGRNITFARAGYDFMDASNIRDLFHPGERVPVHYNPSHPAESVLRPKSTVGMFSRVPGIFMFLVGIISMVVILTLR